MKKRILLILSSVAMLLAACTKKVDVDVPNGGERLVIEASIDWIKGTNGNDQKIKLSKTGAFFDNNANNIISDANVEITKDDDGKSFVFIHQGNGEYTTNEFEPVIGQSYTLTIEYNENIYKAQETMYSVVNIKEVTQSTDEGFSSDDIEVSMTYDDPVDIANFYVGIFQSSHKPVPTIWAFNDILVDGNESMFFMEDSTFTVGNEVDLTLLGVSEEYFNYVNLIVQQSSQSFIGPFQVAPVQVKGNCYNVNDAEEEVLGYFRLCEADKDTHTIE